MYSVNLINSQGRREGGFDTMDVDRLLAELRDFVNGLAKKPSGARIEIVIESDEEEEEDTSNVD